jgi:hypothetical protein
MTTINSVLNNNAKMPILLGDKEINISPLKIKDLYTHFENKIRKQKIDKAKELANILEGRERVEFMMEIYNSSNTDIDKDIERELRSINGIIECFVLGANNAGEDITLEQMSEHITVETLEEYLPGFYFLLGQEAPKKEVAKKTKNSKTQSKK